MGGVFVIVVFVVVRCGFGLIGLGVVGVIGGGRKGEDTKSRWFGDEGWGGGAGIYRIGGGLGFGAAGVAGLLGLGEGEGGCAEEEEEG